MPKVHRLAGASGHRHLRASWKGLEAALKRQRLKQFYLSSPNWKKRIANFPPQIFWENTSSFECSYYIPDWLLKLLGLCTVAICPLVHLPGNRTAWSSCFWPPLAPTSLQHYSCSCYSHPVFGNVCFSHWPSPNRNSSWLISETPLPSTVPKKKQAFNKGLLNEWDCINESFHCTRFLEEYDNNSHYHLQRTSQHWIHRKKIPAKVRLPSQSTPHYMHSPKCRAWRIVGLKKGGLIYKITSNMILTVYRNWQTTYPQPSLNELLKVHKRNSKVTARH